MPSLFTCSICARPSLTDPALSTEPFCSQQLSPPHCLRSASPITAHWLMCYYRQTQLTGIPYNPTRALPSFPQTVSLSLSLPPSPSPLLSDSQCNGRSKIESSSSPLPVSLLSPSLFFSPLPFDYTCSAKFTSSGETGRSDDR